VRDLARVFSFSIFVFGFRATSFSAHAYPFGLKSSRACRRIAAEHVEGLQPETGHATEGCGNTGTRRHSDAHAQRQRQQRRNCVSRLCRLRTAGALQTDSFFSFLLSFSAIILATLSADDCFFLVCVCGFGIDGF
jgi:hypothetical protein